MAEKERDEREKYQQHVKLKLNKNNSSVCSRAQFSLNLTLDRVGFVAALFFIHCAHQVIRSNDPRIFHLVIGEQ